MEESHVHSLPEHVSLDGLQHYRARFERIAARGDVHLRIECVDFERVVMQPPRRGCARSPVVRASGTDLKAAVRTLCAGRYAFGQTGRRRWQIPHEPMQLIVRCLVARDVRIVDVKQQPDGAGRDVGPAQGRRHLLAGLRVPHGNLRDGTCAQAGAPIVRALVRIERTRFERVMGCSCQIRW